MTAKIYSHLARRMVPRTQPQAAPRRHEPGAKPVDNSGALEDAALMVEDLQLENQTLRGNLQAAQDKVVELEREVASWITDVRQTESKYLEASVRAGEATATRAALESALANSNAMNTRLAAMKPPPAVKPPPPAQPPQWKMEVHRDGIGNIIEIIATPGK